MFKHWIKLFQSTKNTTKKNKNNPGRYLLFHLNGI